MLSMGSILIRHVPNGVHKKFKVNCRQRNISMEQAIVQLIEREVVAARRSRKAKAKAKAKAAGGRLRKPPARKRRVVAPRGTTRRSTSRTARPKRTVRRRTTARTTRPRL